VASDPHNSSTFEWRHIYRDGLVHLPGLAMCTVGTVLLTKISSLLAPFNLYFTFTDLVRSGEGGYGLLPFLVKLLIPFTVGVVFFNRFKHRDATLLSTSDHQKINVELTAASGAAFGAILLSWPAIVLWEFIVSPAIFSYRVQFVFVYILYIISFGYVACAGVMAARLVWLQGTSKSEIRQHFKTQYQFVLLVWTLVFALASGGFADWASKQLVPS